MQGRESMVHGPDAMKGDYADTVAATIPASRVVISSSASATMRPISSAQLGMSSMSPMTVPTVQIPASKSPSSNTCRPRTPATRS